MPNRAPAIAGITSTRDHRYRSLQGGVFRGVGFIHTHAKPVTLVSTRCGFYRPFFPAAPSSSPRRQVPGLQTVNASSTQVVYGIVTARLASNMEGALHRHRHTRISPRSLLNAIYLTGPRSEGYPEHHPNRLHHLQGKRPSQPSQGYIPQWPSWHTSIPAINEDQCPATL